MEMNSIVSSIKGMPNVPKGSSGTDDDNDNDHLFLLWSSRVLAP